MPGRHALSASVLRLVTVATLVAWAAPLSGQGSEPSSGAIDAQVWTAIATTVLEHDIAGMGATYHPDAVLVTPQGTMPIAQALAGWGQSMEAMKRDGSRASVAFRFSVRQDGTDTAFESGMFNYAMTDSAGATTRYIVPFEALLVQRDGRWLIIMEHQLAAADESAWNAMPH